MTKCRQCNVTISDNTTVCPLCRCVVEPSAAAAEDNYPDVWIRIRRVKHICNIILVGVLTASVILAIINAVLPRESWWSVIPITALLYAYLVFRVVFVSRKGYRWKVFIPLIFALALMVVIDIETGFYGWSMNYVFPSGILLTDLIILILMLTNLKNWQSYMIIQMIMIAVCVIPLVLWAMGIITNPVMTIVAAAVTACLFMGAVILGGRTARSELKRRFHIR